MHQIVSEPAVTTPSPLAATDRPFGGPVLLPSSSDSFSARRRSKQPMSAARLSRPQTREQDNELSPARGRRKLAAAA